MKWVLFDFKSANEAWFEQAEVVYLKKINHFVKFEILHLKSNKMDREQAEQKIKFEEAKLLEKLTSDDYVVLFDEKGKKLDSLEFARMVELGSQSGKKRGVLIIGGAYGISETIKKRASITVSLASFTMNHLVAETVVLEQFYRAHTIMNRIPYHNI